FNRLADISVNPLHHRREGCMRIGFRLVAGDIHLRPVVTTGRSDMRSLLTKYVLVLLKQLILRYSQLRMWHHSGHEEEKWFILIRLKEGKGSSLDQVRSIGSLFCASVARKIDFLLIVPQIRRIVTMGISLAQIAIKLIKPLAERLTGGLIHSQAPLSKVTRHVTCFLKNLTERLQGISQCELSLRLNLESSPYRRVPGVETGQKSGS